MTRRPNARIARRLLCLLAVCWLSTACRPPVAENATEPSHPGPRRDLTIDEAAGGHTLARHVGRDPGSLRRRLRQEPGLAAASSFDDRESAERAVTSALEQFGNTVAHWLSDRRRARLVLDWRGDARVGIVLERGARKAQIATGARIVLARSGSGFFVLTAYPERSR